VGVVELDVVVVAPEGAVAPPTVLVVVPDVLVVVVPPDVPVAPVVVGVVPVVVGVVPVVVAVAAGVVAVVVGVVAVIVGVVPVVDVVPGSLGTLAGVLPASAPDVSVAVMLLVVELVGIAVVDTPGFHKPRTLLGERLNDVVISTLTEVDVIAMCVPANEKVGPGDRYIAQELRKVAGRTAAVAIVTKTDLVPRDVVGERLVEAARLGDWAEVVPVSARDGFQVDLLTELLVDRLPESPPLYPEGELTDEPERVMVAELIREAALAGVRDELPHSIAVVVEEMSAREGRDDLLDIEAVMFVERDSQKGIVIGPGGARLKQVGSTARRQIEALLGSKVYLDLRVKVAKDWQRDPKQLRRLGF